MRRVPDDLMMIGQPPNAIFLGDIFRALKYRSINPPYPVTSVEIDSRAVQDGSLFVAFNGEQVDGHDFVPMAFENGAIAALVERPNPALPVFDKRWRGDTPIQIVVDDTQEALQKIAQHWRKQFDVNLVGITGSVGKTTTKELTHAVLSERYNTLKTAGNRNNEIGLPLTLLGLKPEHQCVVLEMGMYSLGEIATLAEIARPNIGVITLVGTVHMEHVGSQKALVQGKRELVEALPRSGVAILNHDEPLVMGMASHTSAAVFTYGTTDQAHLWADRIRPIGMNQVQFNFNYQGDVVPVKLPLPGVHSVYTALRAAAVGLMMSMTWDEILTGLERPQTKLRMLTKRLHNGALLIDDTYNASPKSMIAALELLAHSDTNSRRVAILGDMLELGVDELDGHCRVGGRAADIADVLIVVGKRAQTIGYVAIAYGMSPSQVHFAADAESAVPIAHALIEPTDTVLIKASRGIGLDAVVSALKTP